MIEQLIQKFSESWCFAPTFGCASLLVISSVLFIVKSPFQIVMGIIDAVKNATSKD